jgi:hypothetical protein
VLIAALLLPVSASATKVSGVLLGPNGKPLAARQLHFEERVTGDIFLARTAPDGSFSVDLPPGAYDLRTESGAMVVSGVSVDDTELSLGQVREPSAFSLLRLFHLEGIVRGTVGSPAPSTSNIPAIGERARSSEAETEAEPPSSETSPAASSSPATSPKAASAPAQRAPAPIE